MAKRDLQRSREPEEPVSAAPTDVDMVSAILVAALVSKSNLSGQQLANYAIDLHLHCVERLRKRARSQPSAGASNRL